MFLNVDNSSLKLGDIKVSGLEGEEGYDTTVSLQFLDGNGMKIGNDYFWYDYDDSTGGPRSGTEGEDWAYGWYDYNNVNMNDTPIAAGEGVWAFSKDEKYAIQGAGLVPTGPIAVTLRGGGLAKLVANPMPAGTTLGNVWVTGLEGEEGYDTSVSLQFLDGNGMKIGNDYFWYDYDDSPGEPRSGTEGEDWAYGWYDYNNVNMNATPLAAGEGVWVFSKNTKYSMNFKSPLQAE